MSFNEKTIKPPEIGGADGDLGVRATEPFTDGDLSPTPVKQEFQSRKIEIERYAETIPSKYRSGYLKSTKDKASRAAVIKAKCLDCVGYEDGPNRIRNCSTPICPNWSCRPYQKK